jgi:hypothetical protein
MLQISSCVRTSKVLGTKPNGKLPHLATTKIKLSHLKFAKGEVVGEKRNIPTWKPK